MRNFKPRKDVKAAFLKRLRRKRTFKKLSHKAGDCVEEAGEVREAHTSIARKDNDWKKMYNLEPRKDANATIYNACIERELPKKRTSKLVLSQDRRLPGDKHAYVHRKAVQMMSIQRRT